MVQVYGEDGALETAVDILFRMNFNDLAVRIIQAIDRPVEQQVSEPPPSGVKKTQRDLDSTLTLNISCPVCLSIYTEPVVLQCGHSFCRKCIHCYWKSVRVSLKCPSCRRVNNDSEPPINFALKSLIQNYTQRRVNPSGRHRDDSYQTSVNVKEKQEAFEKVKQFCDSSIEQIKNQSRNTENKIKKNFKKLHLRLHREQEARLEALRKEETEKIQMMHKITELNKVTLSLSDIVKGVEDLQADNSFTQTFRTEMERAQNALPDPQLLPHVQIDESKHVKNLQLEVWKKIRSDIESDGYRKSSKRPKILKNEKRKIDLRHLGPSCSKWPTNEGFEPGPTAARTVTFTDLVIVRPTSPVAVQLETTMNDSNSDSNSDSDSDNNY
ncbi:E3 ubiquitin-protein ligase TRIM35-like isoform X2 [Seriola aureovittata]|nr:E3 ubiquitin-protein ligase TRIM35-like isoform X2 [Seriola aureovittata]